MDTSVAVDLAFAFIILVTAAQGFERGAVRTVGSVVGFLGGAWAGLRWAPAAVRALGGEVGPGAGAIAVVVAVLACATFGQMVLAWLLARFVPTRRTLLGWAEKSAGGLLGAAMAAGTVWVGAGLVGALAPVDVATVIDGSRVVRAVSAVVPAEREDIAQEIAGLVSASDLPAVVADPLPGVAPDVAEVDPAVAGNTAIRRAGESVLRIEGSALGCGRVQEGTGFVIAPGLVVTNAHVVEGTSAVTVRKGRLRSRAQVVGFDPQRDVAVLAADTGDAAPLAVTDTRLRRGADAVVAGYPLGGPYTVQAARIRSRMPVIGKDIHDRGEVRRTIYAVRVSVQPGNSGGPLLTTSGEVAGVVFARASDQAATAFVLTPGELGPALDEARARKRQDVGRCRAA